MIIKNKRLRSSAKRWVLRQIHDPYVIKAKSNGYRSRAAFKLLEIQQKFGIIKKNSLVIDLGASPGSWSQIASNICRHVIAIDLLKMNPLENVDFINGDFLASDTRQQIFTLIGENRPNVILSDMAPNCSGNKFTDHVRISNLIESVCDFCPNILSPNGAVVCKTFQGGTDLIILDRFKKMFKTVVHYKPKSSRKESKEMYLIATGFCRTH
jgi:23S rRNA (uridine2552-2'-O)-methyltransferase